MPRDCTLFHRTHDKDLKALKLQVWSHLFSAFGDEGATADEFLEYLEKNRLSKGKGCKQYVASLLERMLDLIGEKRVGRLPNGRYLALYAAGTRRGDAEKKQYQRGKKDGGKRRGLAS